MRQLPFDSLAIRTRAARNHSRKPPRSRCQAILCYRRFVSAGAQETGFSGQRVSEAGRGPGWQSSLEQLSCSGSPFLWLDSLQSVIFPHHLTKHPVFSTHRSPTSSQTKNDARVIAGRCPHAGKVSRSAMSRVDDRSLRQSMT